ncbi:MULTISPECIES: methionyl-tRNA formyltransferase [unclassified Helicobacter]|uniref:methionyl-tRNA formyltransferase n=1 Tax=unclassified Helicobacter TaxID=2593540 RepID=UPI000AE6A45B|nr:MULTISPECIES: methionyl-tRNA formyltransferase [unclassified Helicobacter]
MKIVFMGTPRFPEVVLEEIVAYAKSGDKTPESKIVEPKIVESKIAESKKLDSRAPAQNVECKTLESKNAESKSPESKPQKPKLEILAAFTQPDKPVGRKAIITPPPLKLAAEKHGIPVFQPSALDDEACEILESLRPDFIVVVAYGKILPQRVLDIAPCINIHASILPKYRGASPIQQMILSDDSEYGVSIMRMDAGLDSGDLLCVKKFARQKSKNVESKQAESKNAESSKIDSECAPKELGYIALSEKLAMLGASALIEVLENFDSITPAPQDESAATYCKKIAKQDGLIAFDDAREIYKKSLAYELWPGVFLKSGMKIYGVRLIESTSAHKAGEILENDTKNSQVIIGCARGSIAIEELQIPGKQRVNASQYLRSKGMGAGAVLE